MPGGGRNAGDLLDNQLESLGQLRIAVVLQILVGHVDADVGCDPNSVQLRAAG